MPILTSTLLILTGLALITLALRSRRKKRTVRRGDYSEYKLELGARICEAAARNAFGVDLDHTDASLRKLDELIAAGWADTSTHDSTAQRDILYVIAAYIGDVLIRHHHAEWRLDRIQHSSSIETQVMSLNPTLPYLYFNNTAIMASPFEIAEHKLREPGIYSIAEAIHRLLDKTVTDVYGTPDAPPTQEKERVTWTAPNIHSTTDPDDTH